MENIKLTHVLTLTFVTLLLISPHIYIGKSEETSEETDAEENLYVVGDIPEVSVGNDTTINLVFEDRAGFNYTSWVKTSWVLVHLVWPITFGYIMGGGKKGLEEFKKYICLHSIEFQAYIEGNISGWHAIVEPSLITGSTSGKKAKLSLKVSIDGPTVHPKADVIIKVIRKGAGGKVLGVSYHKITLKAKHIYLLDVKPLKSVIEVLPGSTFSVPVEITNKGNYIETYRISVEGDGLAALVGSQLLTINPGETIKTSVQIYTPFSLFDPGTARKIEIKVYPIGSPQNVFTAGISVVTRGVSLQFIPILILIIILLVLLVRLLVGVSRISGKPREERSKNFTSNFKESIGRISLSKKTGGKRSKVGEKNAKEINLQSSSDTFADISSPPRQRNLKKLMSKIKKEEMKQKRKFEKL